MPAYENRVHADFVDAHHTESEALWHVEAPSEFVLCGGVMLPGRGFDELTMSQPVGSLKQKARYSPSTSA
jgi:hypothetical protein